MLSITYKCNLRQIAVVIRKNNDIKILSIDAVRKFLLATTNKPNQLESLINNERELYQLNLDLKKSIAKISSYNKLVKNTKLLRNKIKQENNNLSNVAKAIYGISRELNAIPILKEIVKEILSGNLSNNTNLSNKINILHSIGFNISGKLPEGYVILCNSDLEEYNKLQQKNAPFLELKSKTENKIQSNNKSIAKLSESLSKKYRASGNKVISNIAKNINSFNAKINLDSFVKNIDTEKKRLNSKWIKLGSKSTFRNLNDVKKVLQEINTNLKKTKEMHQDIQMYESVIKNNESLHARELSINIASNVKGSPIITNKKLLKAITYINESILKTSNNYLSNYNIIKLEHNNIAEQQLSALDYIQQIKNEDYKTFRNLRKETKKLISNYNQELDININNLNKFSGKYKKLKDKIESLKDRIEELEIDNEDLNKENQKVLDVFYTKITDEASNNQYLSIELTPIQMNALRKIVNEDVLADVLEAPTLASDYKEILNLETRKKAVNTAHKALEEIDRALDYSNKINSKEIYLSENSTKLMIALFSSTENLDYSDKNPILEAIKEDYPHLLPSINQLSDRFSNILIDKPWDKIQRKEKIDQTLLNYYNNKRQNLTKKVASKIFKKIFKESQPKPKS